MTEVRGQMTYLYCQNAYPTTWTGGPDLSWPILGL